MNKLPRRAKPDIATHRRDDPMICLCNAVPRSKIVAAIERGCTSLGRIYDATRAGAGPCGGTCQYKLRDLIKAKALEK